MAELQSSDAAELRELLGVAKGPRVKAYLQSAIDKVTSAAAAAPAAGADGASTPAAPPVAPAAAPAPAKPAAAPVRAAPAAVSSERFTEIATFGWDQGAYDSDTVSVYVTNGMKGVGVGEGAKDRVTCDFTASSFDLRIRDFNGKNYRLFRDNLEKDILPDKSKVSVRANRITVKLRKVKGDYSYDHWQSLTSKKEKTARAAASKDPMGGVMDMMKEMYESGDDQMKKTIGEAMMKSRQKEALGDTDADFGAGAGAGGF